MQALLRSSTAAQAPVNGSATSIAIMAICIGSYAPARRRMMIEVLDHRNTLSSISAAPMDQAVLRVLRKQSRIRAMAIQKAPHSPKRVI